ncbi:hypothetical protein D9M68_888210 [compost metagenome]
MRPDRAVELAGGHLVEPCIEIVRWASFARPVRLPPPRQRSESQAAGIRMQERNNLVRRDVVAALGNIVIAADDVLLALQGGQVVREPLVLGKPSAHPKILCSSFQTL